MKPIKCPKCGSVNVEKADWFGLKYRCIFCDLEFMLKPSARWVLEDNKTIGEEFVWFTTDWVNWPGWTKLK